MVISTKKVLVIGAGLGQVAIISKARTKGFYVTAVTPHGNYPGIPLADDILWTDIFNKEYIAEYAKDKSYSAVISDQSDLTMPTVAYVSSSLGLPGNKIEQVLAYSNKRLFRNNCELLGIPVPRHTSSSEPWVSKQFLTCPFPWIVKPEDSQSSIGVTRINSKEEIQVALSNAIAKSRSGCAIVEEFFHGHEVVCEGFIYHGKYYNLAFADRKYFDLGNLFIPCQSLFPSTVHKDLLNQIIAYEEKLAEYVHPNFAIVHSEYLINLSSGEIRVVESALRGGGVWISSDLIPMCTGIDINELLLECALGIEDDVEGQLAKKQSDAAGYVCFYLPDGIIESISGIDEIRRLPYVSLACLDDLSVGMKTSPMTYKGARKGPILVKANSRSELNENVKKVQAVLEIGVRTPDGKLKGICWE